MTRGIKKLSSLFARSPFPRLVGALVMIISLSGPVSAADLGLIDPFTLNREKTRWIVLDARPKSQWQTGHIPGARSFYWEDYTRTDAKGVQYSSFEPRELAAALAGIGIDEKTPVVVYGDADRSWGGEGYDVWLLSRLGHRGPVRLLDGGIQAWQAMNLPLARGEEKPAAKKAGYRFALNSQFIVSTEEIVNRKGSFTLVDVRSSWEWIKGRIPGAVHIPWDEFHSGKERRPLSPAELRKLLARHGVDTSKPVVYYCHAGVRSAYAWTVHQLAGLPDARNYRGGWEEWRKQGAK